MSDKKTNPIKKFFLTIIFILLGLIAIIALWCTFSALDKKKPLAMLPAEYVAYLHTDSFYDSVNPLLDLQAADIFLAAPEMSDLRGIFMMLRESEFRTNRIFRYLASRKIDAALYSPNGKPDTFIASIDLGPMSGITRLSSLIVPRLKVQGLSAIQSNGISYYIYDTGSMKIYFKPVKNLIIAGNDFEHFEKALTAKNDKGYTKEQLEVLNKKTDDPIKLIIDANRLATSFVSGDADVQKAVSLLSENSLSLVSFGISDNEINLNIEIPVNITSEISQDERFSKLIPLLTTNSTVPDITTRLSSSIQYYTVLNAGSLEQLMDAAIPFTNDPAKTRSTLKTADNLTKTFFKVSLDELLFSWTDQEFALLGIEGLNDPVFAIKIGDEAKRKQVFESIFNSFLITENKSLILNGVRIPRLELPPFLDGLLTVFNISLPKPYYLVYNNYIYFSQSAETLSSIYASFSNGTNISFNQNWKSVSEKTDGKAAISLFYDLERSRPFFINSNLQISKILELYSIGRADFSIKENFISFNLNAVSRRAGSIKKIPGFPIELNGKHHSKILTCDVSKPTTIFWLEDRQTVKAMNIKTTKVSLYELPAAATISAVQKGQSEYVMALTSERELYLLNDKLELVKGYPVKLAEDYIDTPYLNLPTSYIPTTLGHFYKITDRAVSPAIAGLEDFEDAKISAWYNGSAGVIYEKGFIGKIYVLYNGHCINADNPIMLDRIGFGLPAVAEQKEGLVVGFVSQSGTLSIWNIKENNVTLSKEIDLKGVFYHNVVLCGNNFYALSSTGELHRINCSDGSVLSVQIDNVTTKEGFLSVQTAGGHNYISVGIDGNMIYSFNENLELVSGFPVAGTGVPAFADVNGDNYPDCFALTIDNKLNAWNLR
ncbi:hypothetical protein [Treponema sp.]|uniref:hypothetical protein n=1 Tax=Treponema sp. TaxID=166 RepID=UPI00298EBC46|nr:hypothetical protein [Treponema sp.]MCR5612579.1 hypothetical protein [Treponema sp.]